MSLYKDIKQGSYKNAINKLAKESDTLDEKYSSLSKKVDNLDIDDESLENIEQKISELGDELMALYDTVDYLHESGIFVDYTPDDYEALSKLAKSGLASSVINIGDRIIANWKDNVSGKSYEMPFNVMHMGNVVNADGDEVPGIILQAEYCSSFGLQFDAREAFYYCAEALSAGTYYITIGTTWGNHLKSGDIYEFTFSEDIAANSLLYFDSDILTNSADNTFIIVFAPDDVENILQTATINIVESSDGTSLGTLSSSTLYGDTGLNNLQRSVCGYNRWGESGIRQYLNSDETAENWWNAQNNYDMPPSELATYNGFMAGFDDDFLNILGKIKITTALNTVSDSAIGTSEDTYDTFFLPSLEEEFITPQVSGVEGEAWDYWKVKCGRLTTSLRNTAYVNGGHPTMYDIDSHVAQGVQLRSASYSNTGSEWIVPTNGIVQVSATNISYNFAPACVIC